MTKEVLNFIKQNDGIQRITQTVIKESLNMPKATISRHIKALKQQGLIQIEKIGRETIINLSKEEIPIVPKEKVPIVPKEKVPIVPKEKVPIVPKEKVPIVPKIPSNHETVPSNQEIVPSSLELSENGDEIEDSINTEYERHLPTTTRQPFPPVDSITVKIPRNIQEFKDLLLKYKDRHETAKYLFNRCFIGIKSSRSEFMKYFDLLNYAEREFLRMGEKRP